MTKQTSTTNNIVPAPVVIPHEEHEHCHCDAQEECACSSEALEIEGFDCSECLSRVCRECFVPASGICRGCAIERRNAN